ncbi:calponin homology domain-containing protein DDB_G0272472 [Hermetia illucens]|uniref:calponin homology domain-containing protein DDB_G0272472 n=1 Tax=Hermetia illucens TaxID=343691 RepID=UPI0018CC2D27|nr:calponin homology domain-containing protein DDB_G0272472 [Hermetia illucens]
MNENTNADDKLRSKDTRWDRIRKRHLNSLSVKTETVKKFFAMDFIGRDQLKALSEDNSKKKVLDPVLVMNLRHEMVRTNVTRRTNITSKEITIQSTKSHNKKVEEHYIENELNKFKSELSRSRRKFESRPKICVNLNNESILESLEKCNKHTIDFYTTVQNALQKTNNQILEEEGSIATNQKAMQVSNEDHMDHLVYEKNVRFEDSVEVINYSPRDEILTEMCSSNTSSDVDSVASDIVDGVFENVRMETEIEMVGRSFEALQKPPSDATSDPTVMSQEIPKSAPLQESQLPSSVELLQVKRLFPPEINLNPQIENLDSNDSATTKSSETESKEQEAIISELFQSKSQNKEKILREYFLKWTHATTISKIEKLNLTNKNDRFKKINAFLDKIRREKQLGPAHKPIPVKPDVKENSIILAKKYQNKIKIQQDIIDLQKIKLERQERLIMELKLNKIIDEHKQSKEEVKQELRTVIKTGEVKNRTKAKCLRIVANLRDEEDEDEFSRLRGKALIMPKFLVNMQERAMERNVKHEQAKQRRLQQEAEREAAKIAAEEAKRLEDEEAKQKRIEALKEKRRLEKLAKLEKERARLRAIENNKKCQEYRRCWLLRNIGMEAFKRLIKRKRRFQKKAENHRRTVLKRKIFQLWITHVRKVWEHKIQLADNFYMKITKRFAFRAWLVYHNGERSKYLVAVDWYELKITEAIFQQWLGLMKLQKLIEATKSIQAVSHYNWSLRWKVLDHWRRLPQVLKIEKETEERRQRWRMKIWELLPDYKPNIDE